MLLRDATPLDFPQILQLNQASVHWLSPLSSMRLARLHVQAAYHRVLELDGRVAAFLLAVREGRDYDSPNYRWFEEHYDRFLYIDRVVVSSADQGHGLGHRMYADLFAFARRVQADRVVCEFDVDPPNEASRTFHAHYGFEEVGRQTVGAESKLVSLRCVSL
jgi:predicted GNAT superfamily acetyltransferase